MHDPDRLKLPRVTLVAVSSVALEATLRALHLSLDQIQFGEVLLLSDRLPKQELRPELSWRKIAPICSRTDYSRFMLHELHHHIETDFALCVQWDGYVLDAKRWNMEFLAFDYIGAPWPHFNDDANVGNGGFSLRSKKLLEACSQLLLPEGIQEDVAICRYYRRQLEEQYDICFASEALARRFSFERTERTGSEFGFHGVYNMMKMLPRREFASILAGLESGTLGNLEFKEIAQFAIPAMDLRTLLHACRNRFQLF